MRGPNLGIRGLCRCNGALMVWSCMAVGDGRMVMGVLSGVMNVLQKLRQKKDDGPRTMLCQKCLKVRVAVGEEDGSFGGGHGISVSTLTGYPILYCLVSSCLAFPLSQVGHW